MNAWLATALSLCLTFAHAQTPSALTYKWQAIAQGAWAHYGAIEDFAPANHGDISNAGLVVGNKCAAIIDTGGSPRVGRAQLTAAKALTDKPICYVINTHVHPDHIMGNVAYKQGDDGVQFVGNAKLVAAMGARGRIFLNAMRRELQADADGAEIVAPAISVTDTLTLDLGDRRLLLKAWPTAHTDHDLTVFDESTGTLWTGDLLFVTHAPVVDGSVKGWLQLHEQLKAMNPKLVVPGHGKAASVANADWQAQGQYLQQLQTQMRDAIKQGQSLSQALAAHDRVSQEFTQQWQLLESFHRRNLTAVYAELEWE